MESINQYPDKPWNYRAFSGRNNITTAYIDEISENPNEDDDDDDDEFDNFYNFDEKLDWEHIYHSQTFPKQRELYLNNKLSRLALLSMMDEDYNRDEGVLDQENCMDMVIQNQYIISIMSQYL